MKINPAEMESVLMDRLKDIDLSTNIMDRGQVLSVKDGVVTVYGLLSASMNEMVACESGAIGLVAAIEEGIVSVILLAAESKVREGDSVELLKKTVSVPVGDDLLSRVVNPLGVPLDGLGDLPADMHLASVERTAPGVIDRKSVHESLETGIKAIDLLVPVGRGQRELIIGDRQTGKTALGIDIILNQARINETVPESQRVYSIYVAIGQKQSSVNRIVDVLNKHGAMKYVIIVFAGAADPAPLQFLAPYAGCAMGEHFMYSGRHALIVYDDLSKHAVAYRQMSLLLRRPPGREAYPGDVFYIHSRLLERAAKLSDNNGKGSLTALPIVETQAGDVSAYIPTNVISITDGQIFLESELFHKGIRPAINVGISVSRVGSAAQEKAIKQVAGSIKLDLAQFREIESFTQFGSDVDAVTLKALKRGKALTKLLIQPQYKTVPMALQAILILAGINGYFDDIEDVPTKAQELLNHISLSYSDIVHKIEDSREISAVKDRLLQIIDDFFKK